MEHARSAFRGVPEWRLPAQVIFLRRLSKAFLAPAYDPSGSAPSSARLRVEIKPRPAYFVLVTGQTGPGCPRSRTWLNNLCQPFHPAEDNFLEHLRAAETFRAMEGNISKPRAEDDILKHVWSAEGDICAQLLLERQLSVS